MISCHITEYDDSPMISCFITKYDDLPMISCDERAKDVVASFVSSSGVCAKPDPRPPKVYAALASTG